MTRSGAFARIDESADALFYRQPRFVEHIDAAAIAAVTGLYAELFVPQCEIIDLMSSWVSHLPTDIRYRRVLGLGMNAAELAANSRLDAWVVHDLNTDPIIPCDDAAFDAAALCVSIQYLTRPIEVLADVARVLRPGAPLVITFSNRCFPTKAIAAWHGRDARGQRELVSSYLRDAGGWHEIVALDRSARGGDPLSAVVARAAPRDR